MNMSRVLVIVSVVIFAFAALGAWPSALDDFEPIALGLAVLAASFAV